MGIKVTKAFLSDLIRKLKVGNGRSPYLNSSIGKKSASRIDLMTIDRFSNGFKDKFLDKLLSGKEFSLSFKIGDDESFEKYSEEYKLDNPLAQEREIRDKFDSECNDVKKILKRLCDTKDEIYSETGLSSFAFGFPIVVRKEQSENATGRSSSKYVYAPLAIWTIDINKDKHNKSAFDLSLREEHPHNCNGILASHVEIIDDGTKIPEFTPEDELNKENLEKYISDFFHCFNHDEESRKINLSEIKILEPQEKLRAGAKNYFCLHMSGIFGIYKQQNDTIKASTQELLNGFDTIFDGNEGSPLVYEHAFGAIETDPSQTRIMQTIADKQEDMIIQGPPGTGKSHTITAILTNALQQDQNCLVVCEKKTALEVIAKSLDMLGLSDSYVIIEDPTKDRRSIVERIRNYNENPGSPVPAPSGYRNTIDEQIEFINKINGIHKVLGSNMMGDMKWGQMVGNLLQKRRSIEDKSVVTKIATYLKKQKGKPEELYNDLIRIVKDGSTLYSEKNYDLSNNISYFLDHSDSDVDAFNHFNDEIDNINDLLQSLIKISKELEEKDSLFSDNFDDFVSEALNTINSITNSLIRNIDLFKGKFNNYGNRKLNEIIRLVNEIINSKGKLEKIKYNKGSLKLSTYLGKVGSILNDIYAYTGELSSCIKSLNDNLDIIFSRRKEILDLIHEGCSKYGSDFLDRNNDGFWLGVASWFSNSKKEERHFIETVFLKYYDFNKELSKWFPGSDLNDDSTIGIIEDVLSENNFGEKYVLNKFNVKWPNALETDNLIKLDEELDKLKKNITHCFNNLSLKFGYYGMSFDSTDQISEVIGIFDLLNNKLDQLRNVGLQDIGAAYNWNKFFNNLSPDLQKFIGYFYSIPTNDWKDYFEYGFFSDLLSKKYAEYSDKFQPTGDVEIAKLAHLQSDSRADQNQMIKNKIWHKKDKAIDSFHGDHGYSINSVYLLRAPNHGTKKSLRELIKFDTRFFKNFFPIILTNPSACAQIFKTEKNIFDVVLFDEASQLRVEDTLQCLIRGKRKIVVGDDKQMPPTDFFAPQLTITGDAIEDDNDDLSFFTAGLANEESLLSFAERSQFTSEMLKIHYRSQHPYLIDFSNNAYYQGKLYPFPSSYDYKPIQYFWEPGNYENNCNEKEADKVIEILKSILNKCRIDNIPSIGIATFNIKQKSIIQDRISELRNQDDDIGKKLNTLDNTNFFIKNLDSIQGDERDIIIVSTTFGRGPDGRFVQNFGPINTNNGHRFLNVMITRAKKNLVVVSGIPPEYYQKYEEELAIKNGPYGRAGLYAWLSYVKSVSDGNMELRNNILNTLKLYGQYQGNNENAQYNVSSETSFEEEVLASIGDVLHGCKVEIQKFEAGFMVDISIETPTGQKIAIECDGTSHHDSNEAYSWDMFREKHIQQKCGYSFHRIWSKLWWADTDREIEKLKEFLVSHGCSAN